MFKNKDPNFKIEELWLATVYTEPDYILTFFILNSYRTTFDAIIELMIFKVFKKVLIICYHTAALIQNIMILIIIDNLASLCHSNAFLCQYFYILAQ